MKKIQRVHMYIIIYLIDCEEVNRLRDKIIIGKRGEREKRERERETDRQTDREREKEGGRERERE